MQRAAEEKVAFLRRVCRQKLHILGTCHYPGKCRECEGIFIEGKVHVWVQSVSIIWFLQKSGSSHHDVLCMEVKATSEYVTGTCSFTHLLVLQYVVSSDMCLSFVVCEINASLGSDQQDRCSWWPLGKCWFWKDLWL